MIIKKRTMSAILLNPLVEIFIKLKDSIKAIIVSLYNPVERHRYLYGKRWGWIICSILIIFGLIISLQCVANYMGVNADMLVGEGTPNKDNLLWAILSQFADPGNLPMASKEGAFIALLCAIGGIVCLSGLLVSSLINYISQRSNQWRNGLIFYNGILGKVFFKKYVVVIGVNEQTATIVRASLQRKDVKYILIQTRRDVEKARMRMNLRLDEEDEKKIVYYHGERTSREDVERLRLKDAKVIYVLGEDMHSENEEDHDAFNMACLEHISSILRNSKVETAKECHVSFEYQSTFIAFKATHIYSSLNDKKIKFLPFNVHEIWAKKIFIDNHAVIPIGKHGEKKIIHYLPLDAYWAKREGTSHWDVKYLTEDSKQSVHIVIIGMNQMGVALGMQAALLAHFPNYAKTGNPNLRTTISFIDTNAVREGEFLRSRYDALFSLCRYRTIICGKNDLAKNSITSDVSWIDPMKEGRYSHINNGINFMDLQWEFIEGSIACPKIRSYLSSLANDSDNCTATIAVCLNNPQQSIATALYLPEDVLKRALQILVYQQNSFEMIDKVSTSEKEWKRYERLKPFGVIEGSYSGGTLDNQLAEFTNLVYDYLSQDGKGEIDNITRDFDTKRYRANRLWNELGIVYKLANINLADSIGMKRRSIMDYDQETPTLLTDNDKLRHLAWAEHNRWMTERLTMGYRPLDKGELEKIKAKDIIYDKNYFKHKSRAHVDICTMDEIRDLDHGTYERDTDYEIISRMDDILQWEQMSYLRDFYTGKVHDRVLCDIVKNMCEVSESLWMGKGLVTKAQWHHIMGGDQNSSDSRSDVPMTNVTKDEVEEFLLILNKMTKLKFRLPTQKEWNDIYADMEKGIVQLDDMEGTVWQWTMSKDEKYTSSTVFCGRSGAFKNADWPNISSYWLSNFRSPDLGFRLVLSCNFHLNDINKSTLEYELEDDDKHVITELIQYMVRVDSKQDQNNSFYIQQTPVTQRQWKAITREKETEENNPSSNKGNYNPVENVSFVDAEKFAKKLSYKVNSLWGTDVSFKIPSYEQWRSAARSPKTDRNRILYNEITKSTRRVIWPPKDGMIYDMFGNVWEWCQNTSNGKKPLPLGETGIVRVLMGGSWRFSKRECLDPDGSYWIPEYKDVDVGFRLVISEKEYDIIHSKIVDEES